MLQICSITYVVSIAVSCCTLALWYVQYPIIGYFLFAQGTFSLSANKLPLPHQIVNSSKNTDSVTHYERLMQIEEFPERPGQPDCDYFMKTGDCKYRSSCRYNHPISRSTRLRLPPLSSEGLYSRSVCLWYHFFPLVFTLCFDFWCCDLHSYSFFWALVRLKFHLLKLWSFIILIPPLQGKMVCVLLIIRHCRMESFLSDLGSRSVSFSWKQAIVNTNLHAGTIIQGTDCLPHRHALIMKRAFL